VDVNNNFSNFDLISAKTKNNAEKERSVIGYVRISTPSQSITRQIRNIKEKYPNAVIVEEVYTGTRLDRPRWEMIMRQVRQGKVDTIVFDSVSRLSRSKGEGSSLYLELYRRKINLVFLKEPFINTDEYRKAMQKQIDMDFDVNDKATSQLMKGIFNSLNQYFLDLATKQVELAFEQAEKEVMDLRQRTKEGLMSARLRGVQLGRAKGTKIETKKAIKCKKIIRKHFTAFGGKNNAAETVRLCGNIARSTFYRYVNQMLVEDQEKRMDNVNDIPGSSISTD